ncbi:flagellar filament capping protein FliD [Anaerosalibacter sp. Marseille-P3206]|uniref:flagellar filament capping protein FliD n=1 Tax=Anaerosalibacter sp. Marseille-P3206 TaxID=1871005 RepID=UPI000984429B|nr:flagellar filament capping protein FliD [Anaerosalibacter sp. Marseille-P3206]
MYNNMRITGLASGIDTEEMIQGLMKAERIKYDRVGQEKQVLLWRQEMYNGLNKDFANFILNTRKEFGLTTTTATGAFQTNSYSNLTWVKKATSSNETIATVSSTAKAVNGSHSVKVTQLAEGVKAASGSDIRKENFNPADASIGTIVVNEDGKLQRVNNEKKLEDVANLTFTINDGTKYKDGNIVSFKIEVSNDNGITMNDVVKAINSKTQTVDGKEVSLGVKASYDNNIGRFFLQTEATGKDAKLSISIPEASVGANPTEEEKAKLAVIENSKKLIAALDLKVTGYDESGNPITDSNGALTIGTEYHGQNALINFDGATGIEQSSNQFSINGIDFNLKSQSDDTFTVTVGTDVDAVYDKIKKFVDEYNELVDKTNKLLTDERYRSYQPLTAEQKKEMDKKDIELWEEKAKSGLLRSDNIISRTMQNARRGLYDEVKEVSGSFKLLFQIGIDTEKFSRGSAGGKLEINESKLKDAIRKDTDGVLELLFKEPEYGNKDKGLEDVNSLKSEKELTSTQLEAKRKQSGLINRLQDNLILGMQDIIEKSGAGNEANLYRSIKSNMLIEFVTKNSSISLIDKDVLSIDRKLDDLGAYLVRKENHYYSQFAAMEKAISRMNQQSMWLMQQSSN